MSALVTSQTLFPFTKHLFISVSTEPRFPSRGFFFPVLNLLRTYLKIV